MKEVALAYWRQGANIVLLNGKKPLHEWERWQVERQSKYDFDVLPWQSADGFAVIGATKLNNELYIGAVDWDVKNVGEEARKLGEAVLKKLPITQIEETPSGGQHWIYYCHVKPSSIQVFHNDCAVELLGEGKLIIMAPSVGYRRLNDNTPTVVNNLEVNFYKALSSVGVKAKKPSMPEFWFNREDLTRKPYRKKHPLCVERLLRGVSEGIRNETAIRLALYLVNFRRLKPKKAWNVLLEWNSNNQPPLEEKELQSIFESAQKRSYVFGCNDPVLSSQCRSKVECPIGVLTLQPEEIIDYELEKSKAIRLHPLIDYHANTGLIIGSLLGEASQSLLFLAEKPFILDFESLKLEETFSDEVSLIQPTFAFLHETHKRQMLLLAANYFKTKKIEFPPKNEAFEKVLESVKQYWWISDERYYIAVVCWIIGTYFHPAFVYYPILALQGLRESGKTTLLELLRKMCWNPTGREVALREAPLFRTVQDSRVTYIADITKLNTRSKHYADVIDVYETGTEKGGCVRRIDNDTREPINYMTFSPKAIATRYDLPFTPKCVQIITEKAPSKLYSARRAKLEFDARWSEVVGCLIRSAVKYWREVAEAYKNVEQTDKLMGRTFNYWAPILAVCKVFAPQHYESLLKLAEEEAERVERGDVLSDVEDAVLTVLLEEAKGTKQESIAVPLKELTERATEICPLIKSWHIVKSAVKNLRILKEKPYSKSRIGLMYRLNLTKAKSIAEERGIGLEQKQVASVYEIDIQTVLSVTPLEPVTRGNCPICKKKDVSLVWQVLMRDGSRYDAVCMDCGGYLKEQLRKRDQA